MSNPTTSGEWTARWHEGNYKIFAGDKEIAWVMRDVDTTNQISNAHNAALAAARAWFERDKMLREQLEAAQAAIVNKNAYLKTAMQGATNDKLRNSAREGLAIPSDTSALDAAIAEATKSLVDVLKKYMTAMDAIYNHNEAARSAVVQHFGTLHPKTAMDALEKVKEGE